MVKKSYIDVLLYPLVLWIIFDVVSFAAGFFGLPGIPAQVILGSAALMLSILFGLWVGRRSSKAFPYLWVSILCALMLVVIVGLINTLMSAALITYSSTFQSYVGPGGQTNLVIGVALTLWFEMAMIAIVSAAVAFEFNNKK